MRNGHRSSAHVWCARIMSNGIGNRRFVSQQHWRSVRPTSGVHIVARISLGHLAQEVVRSTANLHPSTPEMGEHFVRYKVPFLISVSNIGPIFIKVGAYTSHAFGRSASRSRLSETEPKWFMFQTSCYAFGGRIGRLANLNANKVNIFTVSYRSFHVYQHVTSFSHMRGALVGRRTTAAGFNMQNMCDV